MSTTTIQEKFLQAYDAYADDIFEYCYSQTAHRDIAKFMTRNIFAEAWNNVVKYGFDSVKSLKKLFFQTAKFQVEDFIRAEESDVKFHNNLWNLTLSQ